MRILFIWPLAFFGRALMLCAVVLGEAGEWLDDRYFDLKNARLATKEEIRKASKP